MKTRLLLAEIALMHARAHKEAADALNHWNAEEKRVLQSLANAYSDQAKEFARIVIKEETGQEYRGADHE